jgi:DNA-binding GntR family transcriptional regulator
MLRDRNGEMIAGQRALAEALGVSKTQVNRLLSQLAGAGLVQLTTGKAGTAVRLVAKAA